MTSKPTPLAFQPAPRPTPRVSADVAEKLTDAAADLGFARPSSPPSTPVAPAFKPAPRPVAKSDAAAKPVAARSTAQTKPSTATTDAFASLKFDVPEELWTTLKIEAAKRRVTVKYLVLEALSHQGYAVDLDAIPEDGRRLR